ncbi:MAG: aldo/keto reductase [Eubacteriales bacterium]
MGTKSVGEANIGTWKALEELCNTGRICSNGVSNFHHHQIEELMKKALIDPIINQIRLCPSDMYDEGVDYCRFNNILLKVYNPHGVGRFLTFPR